MSCPITFSYNSKFQLLHQEYRKSMRALGGDTVKLLVVCGWCAEGLRAWCKSQITAYIGCGRGMRDSGLHIPKSKPHEKRKHAGCSFGCCCCCCCCVHVLIAIGSRQIKLRQRFETCYQNRKLVAGIAN